MRRSVPFPCTPASHLHRRPVFPCDGPLAGLSRLLAVLFLAVLPELAVAAPFTYENAVAEARKISLQPFKSPAGEIPERLLKINYDQWRDIRFIPAKALWKDENLPFTLQFFHPGLYYDRTVGINVIDAAGKVHEVPFSRDLFDYKSAKVRSMVPRRLGFAGFRIHHPINTPDYQDEVAVFVGASYFRAVGRHMNYGLSARGAAIDTWLPSGEEFPYFRRFWIVKPAMDAKQITVYALLDGPSLAGAYEFVIHPGQETVMDVRSTLFPRTAIKQLGIAPMTSMFYYGENTSIRPVDDFRPEIHDSDGLMMETGYGEWLWRPLVNPRSLLVTSFSTINPRGFGLINRDQDYDHYLDMESNYENRPSLWIEPTGAWGPGRVTLFMIPSDKEINDNIVAFWVPDAPVTPGLPLSFDYRMIWHYFADGGRPPGDWVVATHTAAGKEADHKKFVIDFTGQELAALPEGQPLQAVIDVGANARLVEHQLHKNRHNNQWRLVFEIDRSATPPAEKNNPVELRAFLKNGEDVLTETWSYVYQP
jgi:glucans biosynthesis protein